MNVLSATSFLLAMAYLYLILIKLSCFCNPQNLTIIINIISRRRHGQQFCKGRVGEEGNKDDLLDPHCISSMSWHLFSSLFLQRRVNIERDLRGHGVNSNRDNSSKKRNLKENMKEKPHKNADLHIQSKVVADRSWRIIWMSVAVFHEWQINTLDLLNHTLLKL